MVINNSKTNKVYNLFFDEDAYIQTNVNFNINDPYILEITDNKYDSGSTIVDFPRSDIVKMYKVDLSSKSILKIQFSGKNGKLFYIYDNSNNLLAGYSYNDNNVHTDIVDLSQYPSVSYAHYNSIIADEGTVNQNIILYSKDNSNTSTILTNITDRLDSLEDIDHTNFATKSEDIPPIVDDINNLKKQVQLQYTLDGTKYPHQSGYYCSLKNDDEDPNIKKAKIISFKSTTGHDYLNWAVSTISDLSVGDIITGITNSSLSYQLFFCTEDDTIIDSVGVSTAVSHRYPANTEFTYTITDENFHHAYFMCNTEEDLSSNYLQIQSSQSIYSYFSNQIDSINDRIDNIDTSSEGSPGSSTTIVKDLSGITIDFLGDSITYGVGATSTNNNYVNKIHTLSGATVINNGVSGTRISDTSDNSFVQRVSNISTSADIIIIFGGTNDYWHAATDIGTLGDGNTQTLYGGLEYIINYLQTNAPQAQIIGITPPKQFYNNKNSVTNDTGHGTGIQFNEALLNCYHAYSIPVIDLFNEAPWHTPNSQHKSRYTSDGVHLSDIGYDKLARLIINKIFSLI